MGKTYATDRDHNKHHFIRNNKTRYADDVVDEENDAFIQKSIPVYQENERRFRNKLRHGTKNIKKTFKRFEDDL